MKHLAKTYCNFISEAHITPEGNLEGFELDNNDKYEMDALEQAEQIREFLEAEGAERVRTNVINEILRISFTYSFIRYSINLNLDLESADIFITDRDDVPHKIYSDSTDALFDLMSVKGLSFLDK
jgi:hypothetical protein